MGINILIKEELIVNKMYVEELVEYLGVDSLVYLSLDGFEIVVRFGIVNFVGEKIGYCIVCLSG